MGTTAENGRETMNMRTMLFTNNKQQAIVLSTCLFWILSTYPLAGYMRGEHVPNHCSNCVLTVKFQCCQKEHSSLSSVSTVQVSAS